MAVSIKPLSAKIGAEASGADFSHPVPPADLANIKQGLLHHLVMVIRNQSLNPEQLLAAVRLFGETMEQHLPDTLMRKHPEIAVLDSSKMPPDKQNNRTKTEPVPREEERVHAFSSGGRPSRKSMYRI